MSKLFVVAVETFELKVVTNVLKRSNKKYITIKEGERFSDQVDIEIKRAIKNKKELIFVGCEPEKGEWQRYFGENAPKYKVITYRTYKEKSILKRIEALLKKDILTDFERVVMGGVDDYIPGMIGMADQLGMSYEQKEKTIKNILRGKALYNEVTKKALKDAKIAVKGRKEVGSLTIVEYNYSNNGPVMDLLWGEYENLLIKNKKEGTAILFTPNYSLVQIVQASGGETWTTKREESTKYRLFSNHLAEAEGAVMRYFTC